MKFRVIHFEDVIESRRTFEDYSHLYQPKMEATTIENLHETVLLQIFEYLDPKSLLQSTLVCHRWNEIIGSSSNTMKQFSINLQPIYTMSNLSLWYNHLQQLSGSSRKFIDVKIQCFNEEQIGTFEFHNIITNHTFSLRTLTFEMIQNLHPQTVMNVMAALPNLASVNLHYSKFQSVEEVQVENLKSLRHLSVYGTDTFVVKLFSQSKLISFDMRTLSEVGIEHLADFVSSQKNLQSLILKLKTDNFFSLLFSNKTKFEGFSSKLEKFKFEYQDASFSRETEDNFINFLRTRGSNLKELELKGTLLPKSFAFIFSELKFLRKFTVDPFEALRDEKLQEKIHSSSSIEHLEMLCFISESHEREVLNVNAILNMPLFSLLSPYLKEASSQKLQSLIEEELTTVSNLGFLLKKSSIKKLTIEEFNFCSLGRDSLRKLLYIFTATENLKYIELAGDQERLKIFVEFLKCIEWKHLETLKIDTHDPECPLLLGEFLLSKVNGVDLSCSNLTN